MRVKPRGTAILVFSADAENYYTFSDLKKHTHIITSQFSQKSRLSMAYLVFCLKSHEVKDQDVTGYSLSGGPGEGSASKLAEVVRRKQFHVVV